jgi:hypothetical protein
MAMPGSSGGSGSSTRSSALRSNHASKEEREKAAQEKAIELAVAMSAAGGAGNSGSSDWGDTLTASYKEWRDGRLTFDDWLAASISPAAEASLLAVRRAASGAVDSAQAAAPPPQQQQQQPTSAPTTSAAQRNVMRRCVRRWRARRAADGGGSVLRPVGVAVGAIGDGAWLRPLLLCGVSRELRQAACRLVTVLCAGSEPRALQFTALCAAMIAGLPPNAPESASELIELFATLSAPRSRRLYLAVRGFVPPLMQQVVAAVARIAAAERRGETAGVGDGAALCLLVRLLSSFASIGTLRTRLKASNALPLVLDNYLSLRGVVLQKTTLTDEAAELLRELLTSLSEGEPQAFIAVCRARSRALRDHQSSLTICFHLL